jgi:hypothetical protein
MSVLEEVIKALQSVVAPELKAMQEQIKALDSKMDIRFDAVNHRLDELLQRLALERRLAAVERELDNNRAS